MTQMKPDEGDVKKAVKKALTQRGWHHWMPAANTFGSNGQSDILALRKGVFLAVETKLDKAKGTANQELFMQAVRDNGGLAMLVNRKNLPGFEAYLDAIADVVP